MVPGGIVTVSISAGLALVVALIGRLRRPKALRLEDKRVEADTFNAAMTGMDTAMHRLSERLDNCEARHDECEEKFTKLEGEHV